MKSCHVFPIAKWNFTLRRAINQGDAHKTLLLFRQMKQQPLTQPNNLTFLFIAKACAKLKNLKLSQVIHANVAKSPYISDRYVQNALLDMYVKCERLECAHSLFDEISERDAAFWNVIIMGFYQKGVYDKVYSLFRRMRVDDVLPDAVTIMGLTQLVSRMDGRLLSAVHCFGLKSGFGNDVAVSNTWISGYAKCGLFKVAEMVFSDIALDDMTVVSWNCLIAGCEEPIKAMNIYQRMLRNEYKPDLSTIVNLLTSFVHHDCLHNGMAIHAHGIKFGFDSALTLLNTLINMYLKCGETVSSRYLFDSMEEKSCVTWNIMICRYSEIGNLDMALSLFHRMNDSGQKPDSVTMVHLISACGKVGALEVGKWIDKYTTPQELKSNTMVCNALLDMYAKCGSLIDAEELFKTMQSKTVVSWTALISGFALNGKFQEALKHFDEMLNLGIKPNHITFIAVLQACSHGGFLEKGWEIFNMMTENFGLNPELDHYACMVDLLGRRGKVKEALEFIQMMPIQPDAGIWAALLSACKINHNTEIGEYAGKNLFQLEPRIAAPYVEMANIYASVKDWNGVASMRMKMRTDQVIKSPGQSVIRVNGKSHLFTVGDRCQEEGLTIFETLDCLNFQMKCKVDILSANEVIH